MSELPRVLIVDDSRMVRASLAKHLKGSFEVKEEGDGASAWQTLVLDHSIVAVISDLQMPKLDGYELLENVRSSKLRRLKELPFILVSGEETEDEREKAKSLGVSDFITKGIGTAEILTRLNHLLELNQARRHLDEGRALMAQDPSSGLYTRKYLELQAAQALSHAARHGTELTMMVFGFDNFPDVCQDIGAELAQSAALRFAKLLMTKIRQGDTLGHYEDGQFAIVSPGTSPALCVSFAERVREAVEVAHITSQGRRISLTVSIGVSSIPQDIVTSAGAWLELAGSRMKEAMQAGGNRIVTGGIAAQRVTAVTLHRALELLVAGRPEGVLPQLGSLGLQILPLLKLMDQEFALNLPVGEIERLLNERAQESKKPA